MRRYIAQRAELLGAIRLPNTAFAANAGTSVTTDISFCRKRESPIDIEPDWVHLGQTEDGIPINSYFVSHPDMMLGSMAWDKSMYGDEKETTCRPIPGADLKVQLEQAIQKIGGEYHAAEVMELAEGEEITETLPADPDVKELQLHDCRWRGVFSRKFGDDAPKAESHSTGGASRVWWRFGIRYIA